MKKSNLEKVNLSEIWERDINIYTNDKIDIVYEIENDQLVVQRKTRYCMYCHSEENLKKYKNRFLCSKCIEEIKKL